MERSCPTETATSAPRSAAAALDVRRRDGAQQREGLEVDPDDLEPRLAAGVDVAVDELAVGDDEEHAPQRLAVLGHALGEHLVVEHRLLERDRQHLLRTEADRVRELLRILDPGHLERADADPVVGDPEPHAALRQLVGGEERLQRHRERLGIAQLAVDDDPVLERDAGGLDELGRLGVADPRSGDLGAADLEADELLAAAAAARQRGQRRATTGDRASGAPSAPPPSGPRRRPTPSGRAGTRSRACRRAPCRSAPGPPRPASAARAAGSSPPWARLNESSFL